MTTPKICVRCRHKLPFRITPFRNSSFVSLQQLVKRDEQETQTSAEPSAEGLMHTGPDDFNSNQSRQIARKPEHQKLQENDKLEDLFSSNLRNSHAFVQKHLSASSPSARQSVDEDIQALAHRYYKMNASPKQMWHSIQELFKSNHWKSFEEQRHSDEDLAFGVGQLNVFRDVLLEIAHRKAENPLIRGLPTPSYVTQAYMPRGVMQNWWDQVLWQQLGPYIMRSLYPSLLKPGVKAHNPVGSTTVLKDIMGVWWTVFRKYGEHGKGYLRGRGRSSPEQTTAKPIGRHRWPGIPPTSGIYPADRPPSTNMFERFSEIWPQYPESKNHRNNMFSAAIMTFDIFDRRKAQLGEYDPLLIDAEPLVLSLRRLVQDCSVRGDIAAFWLQKGGIHRHLRASIMRRWRSFGVDVGIDDPTDTTTLPRSSDTNVSKTVLPGDRSNSVVALHALHAQVLRARNEEDAALLTKLWQRCRDLLTTSEAEPFYRDGLFSDFLSSFFSLRCQNQAVEVWNFMISQNHQPTQKHWHAMLGGSAKAKDLTSLREIWSNMLSAGVKPDSGTWATWIKGLMVCGAWQAGLDALWTLGKQWKSQPRDEASQPTLSPVNATLLGLVRNRRLEYVDRVREFAKTHDLALDINAYNILLRPVIRADDDDKVQALFQEMRTSCCQPDIVTFTIILNGLLSNANSTFHTQSPSEQQAAISKILKDMEGAGVEANPLTYTTILDGLLNDRTTNIDAAEAVMQHMASNNIGISPHIYTILITHHFSEDPPNLPAISNLLERAKLDRVPLDAIFYDRMIENYARVGEIEKMLKVLRGIPERGMTPGWLTLTACLRTLIEAEEWDSVKDLVRDVGDHRGLFKHGLPTQWKGKDEFWDLVREVKQERGILDAS